MTTQEILARLAAKDAGYARLAGLPAPASEKPAAVARTSLPCIHLGKPVPPPDRKPTSRTWRECEHPDTPLGSPVCSCKGCGPKCQGYTADEPEFTPKPAPKEPAPLPSVALLASGSDKVPLHCYGEMYDALLAGKPIRHILEIGVLLGDSIRAWRAAFPDAQIVAVDCDPVCGERLAGWANVTFRQVDAGDPEQLRTFASHYPAVFDLIVDDASHKPEHQRLAVEHLRPCLAPNGVMVVEDIADNTVAKELADLGGRVWDNRFETGNPHSRAVSLTAEPLTAGVVIGSYGWPELVELQVKLIRKTCGPVPICVSSDKPEAAAHVSEICRRFGDVFHWPNAERIGHTGGDLSAYFKGAIWGASRGLAVVAKLSQRFLIERPNWLQEGAAELAASKAAIAVQRCSRKGQFPLRTEAALLHVKKWNHPTVLGRIMPRRYWTDAPNGLSAETIISRAIEDFWDGTFHQWSLFGEDRKTRYPGVTWHDSHQLADYAALAKRFGCSLPEGFHCSGWEVDRKAGRYHYG